MSLFRLHALFAVHAPGISIPQVWTEFEIAQQRLIIMIQEVYLLPLTDDGAPDVPGGYIYLPAPSEPPYTVRFAIEGTSAICRKGSLWVNIPAYGERFQRNQFREFKWVSQLSGAIYILMLLGLKAPSRFYPDHQH